MLKNNVRLLIISILMTIGVPVSAELDEKNLSSKIEQLVSQMTLKEKALLTSGRDAWSTQPIERLDIPYIWMADGPHGLRRAPTTDTWGYGNQAPATCFPTASALSASWDMELLQEVGAALGVESNALGVDLLLGPGINIKRSPLAGRNFEYFSEDPFLNGHIAGRRGSVRFGNVTAKLVSDGHQGLSIVFGPCDICKLQFSQKCATGGLYCSLQIPRAGKAV